MSVRTRFAPSPTGDLHLGSARTALFAWLFAKQQQGEFILRIEDTDKARSTPELTESILVAMAWMGLDYSEGPYFQSQFNQRHLEVADELLAKGLAYRCYCSKERLNNLREEQEANKQKPKYDGKCRDASEGDSSQTHVIRFKNPLDGEVSYEDIVYGHISVSNAELDDLIIIRSDGTPTYNFCVVVDDTDMKVSHVIRGDDHINNTPRQVNIMQAMGLTPPTYAHVPIILNEDGSKLSKRQNAASVFYYRDQGILPEALLNYLVRLGWSHGNQELFSRDEMIEHFSLSKVNRSPAKLNFSKLESINHHYMKAADPEALSQSFASYLTNYGLSFDHLPLKDLLVIQLSRYKSFKEIVDNSSYFFETHISVPLDELKAIMTAEIAEAYEALVTQLQTHETWQSETIQVTIKEILAQHGLKFGPFAKVGRLLLTGQTVTPSLSDTMFLLGKERSINAIQDGLSVE